MRRSRRRRGATVYVVRPVEIADDLAAFVDEVTGIQLCQFNDQGYLLRQSADFRQAACGHHLVAERPPVLTYRRDCAPPPAKGPELPTEGVLDS